ncbi:PHP domain-containing protein [Alicyclobacillus acidiphilus]|uniref:PHP domain-containing protein n=1 Tax=Alicyclobacillus acidiphilus TaxID=182455 RepID=UPI00082E976C|nr:PHP domain-containing protein [Alicyclobacillus acidiphilus]
MKSKCELVHELRCIGVLFEIEEEHRRKGKAIRDVADAIAKMDEPLPDILDNLHQIPGAGPKVREVIDRLAAQGLAETAAAYDIRTPASAAALIALPGVGPKTISTLVHTYHVQSLDDLAKALDAHRITGIAGFSKDKLHRLARDVQVLIARQSHWPIAKAWPHAHAVERELAQLPGVHRVQVTGTVRRLAAMNPAIQLVMAVDDRSGFDAWCASHRAVSNLQPDCETCMETIRLTTGDPPDTLPLYIHLCTPDAFGLALMETTGDATHRAVIGGMLAKKGLTPSFTGLARSGLPTIAVPTEETVYETLRLPYLPPELREGEGILQDPQSLVSLESIRGDLHMHSTWSDGSMSIAELVEQAERLGYEYIAITDHSQSLTIARGLTPEALRAQRGEIEEIRKRTRLRILHGSEVDILADGSLDFPDEVLEELDIVVASVHSAFHQSRSDMTKRILRAIRHPKVHILGHMHGRLIGKRAGYDVDTEAVLQEAADLGVMVELNSNPNRLDIWDDWIRQAVQLGLYVPIDTDAHHPDELGNMHYGVSEGIRGWLPRARVPNTMSCDDLMRHLKERSRGRRVKNA